MSINSRATQEFVPIKDIRDGLVILKDNGLRAIIMVSSINFALKSEDERNAVIYQFQDFLNSLDFPVQIVVQSRKFDIKPYLATLVERERKQLNELMRIQIREHIEFIKTFTEEVDIMTKRFFVVVPYTASIIRQGTTVGGKFSRWFGRKPSAAETKRTEEEIFEENRLQLMQRVNVVERGLVATGVRTVRLGTEEVVELFYKLFNPGETEQVIKTG